MNIIHKKDNKEIERDYKVRTYLDNNRSQNYKITPEGNPSGGLLFT